MLCYSSMLGAARGQARDDGQIVLCSGEVIMIRTIDIDGAPMTSTHICPDMALLLMAAAGAPPPKPPDPAGIEFRLTAPAQTTIIAGLTPAAPCARDPPYSVFHTI